MLRYEHGGDVYGNAHVTLDFSINTNPFGLPDAVKQALNGHADDFVRYPDPHCRALTAAIARDENVPPDWVLCGNGAADLLFRLCYAVKPRRALVCAPTFSEYERCLSQVHCAVVLHTLAEADGFALTDSILAQLVPGLDMLFLCQPNNPTGRLIPPDLLARILRRAQEIGAVTVVDECFLDFTEASSCKALLPSLDKLVVLKAFTKMYAMAGLRLGYLLCTNETLRTRIADAGACWSVSIPAQIAGEAALGITNWRTDTRRLIAAERVYLTDMLRRLGLTVYPSDANFLLLQSEIPLFDALLARGILIRPCGNYHGLCDSHYRIAVKTHNENLRLLQAIKEVLYG